MTTEMALAQQVFGNMERTLNSPVRHQEIPDCNMSARFAPCTFVCFYSGTGIHICGKAVFIFSIFQSKVMMS